jgi:hypothetical protein
VFVVFGVCGGVWWGETGVCDALLVSEWRSEWARDGVLPTAMVDACIGPLEPIMWLG